MRHRIIAGICIAVIAACLLAMRPGVLSLSWRHDGRNGLLVVGVGSGQVIYLDRAARGSNPFLIQERWSASLMPTNPTASWWYYKTTAQFTEFKASLVWVIGLAGLVIVVPYVVRWRRVRGRVRRGECRGCGFDLRGTEGEVCGECGMGRTVPAGPARWPMGWVPRREDVVATIAAAGVAFFVIVVAASGSVWWVETRQHLAEKRFEMEGIDVTQFVIETSPRLNGKVVEVAPGDGAATFGAAMTSGNTVKLGGGEYRFTNLKNAKLTDVAIVGASPGQTTVRIRLEGPTRVRLEHVTIDCANDPFIDVRSGGSVSLKECVVVNYNSGAGGSNAIFGVGLTMLVDECKFQGDGGRQAGRSMGNVFDLRGENRVYARHTAFTNNQEVDRSGQVTFDECQITTMGSAVGGQVARPHRGAISPTFPAMGKNWEFTVASDEDRYVNAAVSGDDKGLDVKGQQSLRALRSGDDPWYWLAIYRSPAGTMREVARKRLGELGHPTKEVADEMEVEYARVAAEIGGR